MEKFLKIWNSLITGCLFHFKQCIRRKLLNLHLITVYNKSVTTMFLVKLVFSLVYVKPTDVVYGYSDVVLTYLESKKDVDEDIEENYASLLEFTNYIDTTWVGKVQTRTGVRTPLYAVELWNKYAEVLEGLPVTKNQCESFDAKWNATLSKKPKLWEILAGFQRQESFAETMLREDSLATNVPNADLNKQRKKNLLSCQADSKKMVESYENMPLGIYMNNIVRFFKDD